MVGEMIGPMEYVAVGMEVCMEMEWRWKMDGVWWVQPWTMVTKMKEMRSPVVEIRWNGGSGNEMERW